MRRNIRTPITDYPSQPSRQVRPSQTDFGPDPYVVNIERVTKENRFFRNTLWTGTHLQLTVMCIPRGGEIGLENHSNLDQFLYIEEGRGLVKMGRTQSNLDYQRPAVEGTAVIIPAGTWHNLINTGSRPIKLFSIYAPPEHPKGTIHRTKEESDEAEHYH